MTQQKLHGAGVSQRKAGREKEIKKNFKCGRLQFFADPC